MSGAGNGSGQPAPTGSEADRPAGPSLGQLSFEELLEQLETLVGRLSSGEVGIEAAADLYEQAGRVYNEAKSRLDAVQARIDALRDEP